MVVTRQVPSYDGPGGATHRPPTISLIQTHQKRQMELQRRAGASMGHPPPPTGAAVGRGGNGIPTLPGIQIPSSFMTGNRRSTPAYTPPTLSYAPPSSTLPGGLPPPPSPLIHLPRTRSGANSASRNPLRPGEGVAGMPLPRTGGAAAPPEGFKKLRMAGARQNFSPTPLYQIPGRPTAPRPPASRGEKEGAGVAAHAVNGRGKRGSRQVEVPDGAAGGAPHGAETRSLSANGARGDGAGAVESCQSPGSGGGGEGAARDEAASAAEEALKLVKVEAQEAAPAPKMSKQRLEQLQGYIGSARTKQDKWTTKVTGGGLFKKNQEMSFVENLQEWHAAGMIVIHQVPTATPLPWGGDGEDTGVLRCDVAAGNQDVYPGEDIGMVGWTIQSQERWHEAKRLWFCNGCDVSGFKTNSFNMCLRHMGFRPTKGSKGAKYGTPGTGYDWEGSSSFVFDSELRLKYASKRSKSATSAGKKRKRGE